MKWSSLLILFSSLVVVYPSHAVRKQRKVFLTGEDTDIFENNDQLPTTSKSKKSKKTPKLKCTVKHKKKKKSTRAPSVSPPSPGGGTVSKEDCPTMVSACSLLEMGEATFNTFDYLVKMRLAITERVPYVVAVLQQYLTEVLGDALSGCNDFDVRRQRRRMQETGIMKIDVDVEHDSTCSDGTTFTDATCEDMDVALQVTHDEGDPNVIRTSLLANILARCTEIKTLPGVSDALDPCPFITISGEESSTGGGGSDSGNGGTDGSTTGDDGTGTTQDGDGVDDEDDGNNESAVVQEDRSEEKVQTGGYISIAIGLLLLLLLLILFARRRRYYLMATKHKYLEDDGNDDETDTYLKDSDEDSQENQTRQVHVIGEADSVVSGWTGYTRDYRHSDNGGLYPGSYSGSFDHSFLNQDVHQCSSATCEICEQRRQAGIQFVPTRMPSHSSIMPTGVSRSYTTEDTVTL